MTINNTLTKEKFGYQNEDLSPFSTRPIVIDCDFCFKSFERKKMQFSKPSRRDFPHACPKCDQIKSNWKKQDPASPREYFLSYESRMGFKNSSSILWDKTKEIYGYGADDVNPRSEKRILVLCEFCASEYESCLATLNRVGGPSACKPCSSLKSQVKLGESPKETFNRVRIPVNETQLNVNETILMFGYDPRLISSKSEKKVIINCYVCGSPYETWMVNYSEFAPFMTCKSSKCRYEKTKKTLREKYGVSTTLDIPEVRAKLTDPKSERLVAALLQDVYKVEFERSKTFGPYSFDFYIPSAKLLLECQGDFFHNFKENGYSGTPRDQAKATYVSNYVDANLVHIWEHEIHIGRVKKILDHHLGVSRVPELVIKPSDVTFRPVGSKQAFEFLVLYHYLGSIGRSSTSIGAFHGEELIGICSFGHVTRKETIAKTSKQMCEEVKASNIIELKRFALRSNVVCKNLGSKFMAESIKELKAMKPDVRYIVSFSDPTVGDVGGLYKASNFQKLGVTSKSYHYMDGTKAIHKKTVYNLAVSAKMTESEFVAKSGLHKIEEKPKVKWVFKTK